MGALVSSQLAFRTPQLNQLVARSDEQLRLLKSMDTERTRQEHEAWARAAADGGGPTSLAAVAGPAAGQATPAPAGVDSSPGAAQVRVCLSGRAYCWHEGGTREFCCGTGWLGWSVASRGWRAPRRDSAICRGPPFQPTAQLRCAMRCGSSGCPRRCAVRPMPHVASQPQVLSLETLTFPHPPPHPTCPPAQGNYSRLVTADEAAGLINMATDAAAPAPPDDPADLGRGKRPRNQNTNAGVAK